MAHSYKIEIHNDKDELAEQTDSTTLRVFQPSITFQFCMNEPQKQLVQNSLLL